MAGLLEVYLDQAARTPFAWGVQDCLLFPAGWVVAATGVDPAADFRGRYRTAEEAGCLIRRAGGFLPLVTEAMADFPPVVEPEPGDVGVVRAVRPERGSDLVGAIRVGGRWCMIWAEGLWFGRPETVAVWRTGER